VARTAAAGSKTSHSVHWVADEHSYEHSRTVSVITAVEPAVLSLSPSDSTVILDSGASATVVSSNVSSYVKHIHPTYSHVATAGGGQSLYITGEGALGLLSNVLLSDNIRHNCISIPQ
jgi:hypothetical protein